MPTSINYPPDARGKWSLPILLALIAVAVVSFLVPTPFKFSRSRLSKEQLVSELNAHLREETFEQLYEDASDVLRRKVTKEKFVRRMSWAAVKLRDVDEGLNFKPNALLERALTVDGRNHIMTSQDLGEGDKAVTMLTYWDDGKFVDLHVMPGEHTPPRYAVHSILLNFTNINGQLVQVED